MLVGRVWVRGAAWTSWLSSDVLCTHQKVRSAWHAACHANAMHAPTSVPQGSKSVEVRPVGVSKGASMERILQYMAGGWPIFSMFTVACLVLAMSAKTGPPWSASCSTWRVGADVELVIDQQPVLPCVQYWHCSRVHPAVHGVWGCCCAW